MARYRHKTPEEIAWNQARREITRAFDTALQNWREDRLNDLLSSAFEEYTMALKRGVVLEIEPRYKRLAREVVKDLERGAISAGGNGGVAGS